jgi:hypothetical protein
VLSVVQETEYESRQWSRIEVLHGKLKQNPTDFSMKTSAWAKAMCLGVVLGTGLGMVSSTAAEVVSEPLVSFTPHHSVDYADLSPNGDQIVAIGRIPQGFALPAQHLVTLWDSQTGEFLRTLIDYTDPEDATGPDTKVSYSSGGRRTNSFKALKRACSLAHV